jgi:hypothetical protein
MVGSILKNRGKHAKLKKGGKRAIGPQNRGSLAIGPIIFSLIFY